MNTHIRKIATNYNVEHLQGCFDRNIKDYKPKTNEEWQELIKHTIYEAHCQSWTVWRYDENCNELVFIDVESGLSQYQCTFDNEDMTELFNKTDIDGKWFEDGNVKQGFGSSRLNWANIIKAVNEKRKKR